jgi:microcystin-dependent protein
VISLKNYIDIDVLKYSLESLAAKFKNKIDTTIEPLATKEEVSAISLPIGSITQFAGTLAPTDYMICDGSSLAKADYPELFDVIGYAYGGEDSMFNLPNLQGRIPVGFKADDQTFGVVGSEGGERTHTLETHEMPKHDHEYNATHSHTFTGKAHSHSIGSSYAGSSNYFLTSASQWETDNGDNVSGSGDSYPKQDNGSSMYSTTTYHSHSCGNATATGTVVEESIVGFTSYTGESRPHNNLQPYIVMNYIIKVK